MFNDSGRRWSYSRAREVLRAYLGLPPAGDVLDLQPVVVPVLDVLSLYDLSEQEISEATSADAAPGATANMLITVPSGETWLVDAVNVNGTGPATSGNWVGAITASITRGIARSITLVGSTQVTGDPGMPGFVGQLLQPPFPLHGGDSITGRAENLTGSVGNLTALRTVVLYRKLPRRT